MDSTIVIKVKYGETLRRFNSRVVDGELDLDVNGLREKVFSLFSFPAGSELVFTYVDEDGDVVTLADEEDLRDIMRQLLNPVRITVKLNTERSVRSHSRSSGNTNSVRSLIPVEDKSTEVSQLVNSIPDDIREIVKKLSPNGFASSPSMYNEILESIANVVLTYQRKHPASIAKSEHSGSSTNASATKESNGSMDVKTTKMAEMKGNIEDQGNKAGFSEDVIVPATDMADGKDKPLEKLPNTAPVSIEVTDGQKQDDEHNFSGYSSKGNCINDSSEGNKVAINGYSGDKKKDVKKSNELRSRWKHVPKPLIGIDSPFSDFPKYLPRRQHPHRVAPFKRSYNNSNGIASIFHTGVRCDGCGVHPITGPRFKSKVKEDYDLCNICFADIGTEAEYTRMDYPLSYRSPVPVNLRDTMQQCHSPMLPIDLSPADRSKLDSCFIQDVNVPDGTIMTPSTTFTKIWRMRNNGAVVWPRGTHLAWIAGDRFSKTLFCDLKIPADGCPVDKEIDVVVDFTAPERPGRYISYWMMASPSGHKFGQRVWVLIQVDASSKDLHSKNVSGFNLNFPPASGGIMDFQNENICVQPMGDGHLKTDKFDNAAELVEQVASPLDNDQGFIFPSNDNLLDGGANKPNSTSLEASSHVTYPAVDISKVETISTPQNQDMDLASSVEGGDSNDEVEQTLLKELEAMGFKQIDLNKEILRKNEYNLEQSVDDLCDVAEWDPLLKELEEMGFVDNEMNKMLLKKNNGSIKRVVMELIAGENA